MTSTIKKLSLLYTTRNQRSQTQSKGSAKKEINCWKTCFKRKKTGNAFKTSIRSSKGEKGTTSATA